MATLTQRVIDLATLIGQKLKTINLNIGTLTSLTTTEKTSLVLAINELVADINTLETATGLIDDTATTSTTKVWSANKVRLELIAYRDALLGGAGAAYDTLKEIQDLLIADDTEAASLLLAVNKRVRFDAAQTLTTAEKLQARTNIDAQSATDIGFADNNFVAVLNAAMV